MVEGGVYQKHKEGDHSREWSISGLMCNVNWLLQLLRVFQMTVLSMLGLLDSKMFCLKLDPFLLCLKNCPKIIKFSPQ